MAETQNKKRRHLIIGPKIWGQLKALAAEEEQSMSSLAREALLDLFKKRKIQGYDPVKDTY